MSFISRGFRGHREDQGDPTRIPPGQHRVTDFPVLSAGPTPRASLDRWSFSIQGLAGDLKVWSWDEFQQLPTEPVTTDIHCVTKWTKLDTRWEGVSLDTLWEHAPATEPYVLVHSDGGYTTNVPVADLTGGKAWIVHTYDGEPLAPEHGGPARLLVPHLYFWKSAKWVRALRFMRHNEPGFWESNGYHIYGDPWKEQRYAGD